MAGDVILIVDYSSSIRQLIAGTLEGAGYQVFATDSGAQALELVRSRVVDLIICNVVMPDMSGLELVMAAQEFRPEVRVLLTTGHVHPGGPAPDEVAFATGDPLRPEVLIGEVRRILGSGKR